MEGPLSVWTNGITGWHYCWVILDERMGMLFRFKSHSQRRRRLGFLARFSGIRLLVAKKFLSTGSVHRQRRRKAAVLDEDFEIAVLAYVRAYPEISIRNVIEDSGGSIFSVWKVLRKHKLHPYHISLHQDLSECDFEKRLEFSNWALIKTDEDPDFLTNVLWTDEAQFCRNGNVNVHNAHYWSDSNPHWLRQHNHQIWDRRYIGPTLALVSAKLQDAGLLYEQLACGIRAFLSTARAAMTLLEQLKLPKQPSGGASSESGRVVEMILPDLVAQLNTLPPRKKAATMLSLLRSQAAGLAVDPLSLFGPRLPPATPEGSALLKPVSMTTLRGLGCYASTARASLTDAGSSHGVRRLPSMLRLAASFAESHANFSAPSVSSSTESADQFFTADSRRNPRHSEGSRSFKTSEESPDTATATQKRARGPAQDLRQLCSPLGFGASMLKLDYPLPLLQPRSLLEAMTDLFACPELFVRAKLNDDVMSFSSRCWLNGVHVVTVTRMR
ncbi:hypothetical protein HPB47_020960 [Ixodes persulcatus]|uniref:Uncharacterized protein n=1 Tax=Ixodes persulcatus TaxID=34615 RepID=A0AC60QDV7_IXOPE|nr:hypothetical protein HPB47_020960 [Ixodes persulcatus]